MSAPTPVLDDGSRLRRYAAFVVRHAWTVLALSMLGAMLLTAGVLRLKVELDHEKQLPQDHPYIVLDKKIRAEFGGKQFVAIAVIPKQGDVWTTPVLSAVHALTLDVLDAPSIIRPNVVSLSSPYVRVPVDQGGALRVDTLMRDVPRDATEVAEIRARYLAEPLFRGTVVSADGRAALVLADFYDDARPAQIVERVRAIVARHASPDWTIAVTGQPIYEDEEAVMVRMQGRYFSGTLCAILVVLYLAFGQLQGVVLPIATALLATGSALGLMGWCGIPMNSWTAAAPLVVVTVGAGHSAQMLKRYYEEFRRLGDRAEAIVESTARIGMVMTAAGVTAGSGFAALTLLGIPTLAYFGIGVASGIFAAIVLEMTFMLALRAIWPSSREKVHEGVLSRALGALLRPVSRAVERRPRWVVASFTAAALLAFAGLPRLTTEINAHDYWSEKTHVGQDQRMFERHFPSTTTVSVLLEGPPGSMKTPEALALMNGLEAAMRSVHGVGRTASIAGIIQRIYEVFAPEEAAKGPPTAPDLVAQLFFLGDSPAFERFVDRSYARSVVFAYLDREGSLLTRQVIEALEAFRATHASKTIRVSIAGGVGPTLLALNDDTVRGKILNIALVLVVIFVIASALLRTPLGGAYVVAPLVMALIANLGLFAWLGIAFDVGGASIAAIAVGIGADYAIYFLYRLREELDESGDLHVALKRAMETSGRAVLFVALAISAGFAIYVTADFYSFRIVGTFVPLTMLVSCLTTLTLLPALIELHRPAFLVRRAVTAPDARAPLLGTARSG